MLDQGTCQAIGLEDLFEIKESMMINKTRSGLFIFHAACLILAVLCFYFSISEALFMWFYPDELGPMNVLNGGTGIIGCTGSYYLHTSVNRLSADFGLCLMARTTEVFSSPYFGWIFSRLCFYGFIPLSISFLFNRIFSIEFKRSLILALILSSFAIFILTDGETNYMFGFSLAIYATATFSFFMLISLFTKSLKSDKHFVWFCIFYLLNLNSHEVFLAISGFFIPLYIWYAYPREQYNQYRPLNAFIKTVLIDKKFITLVTIYAISTVLNLLAPGVRIRQHLWPSSGTFLDGIAYIIASLEESAYFIYKYSVIFILVFSLGLLCRFLTNDRIKPKQKLLHVLLLCAPLMYLLVTSYLIGITPSLWGGSIRTHAFRLFDPYLIPLVSNKLLLLKHGQLTMRQYLFFSVSSLVAAFFIGFLIAEQIAHQFKKNWKVKANWSINLVLFLVVIAVFFLHPDGKGSLRILATMFEHKNINLKQYSPIENKEAHSETSISKFAFTRYLFPRNKSGNHETDVTNILVDHYLRTNQHISPKKITNLIYVLMPLGLKPTASSPWQAQIYSMYKVSVTH